MQINEVPHDLEHMVFETFYWFARFEFALKENGYLKHPEIGSRADPDWNGFIRRWEDTYRISKAGLDILAENPEMQMVGNQELVFRPVEFPKGSSELRRVTVLLKTVRNNLFHGGKHGAAGWEQPERMRRLLPLVRSLLDELARHGRIEGDYLHAY